MNEKTETDYKVTLFTEEELKRITEVLSERYPSLEVFGKKYGFSEDDYNDVLSCEITPNSNRVLVALSTEMLIDESHAKKYRKMANGQIKERVLKLMSFMDNGKCKKCKI